MKKVRGAPGRRAGAGRRRGGAQGLARRGPTAGQPARRRRHGRASDDPPRHLPLVILADRRRPRTGWPTGRAPSSSSGRATSPRPASSAPSSSCVLLLARRAAARGRRCARCGRARPPSAASSTAGAQQRGLDALSSGMIAIGAGDRALALRYAGQARKALPNEPLTHLLRAQTAQLTGDRATARRIFEAMLASPDTEQLGLRGLFLEAAARGRAGGRAPVRRARAQAQPQARLAGRGAVRPAVPRRRLAGRARHAGDRPRQQPRRQGRRQPPARRAAHRAGAGGGGYRAPTRRWSWRCEAHRLAPDLVPAAAIAGRILASQGNTPRAARVLLKTWRLAPHPDLAAAYAYARPGDSPRDRLNRMRHLGAPDAARRRGADRASPSRPSRRASGTRPARRWSRCSRAA